MSDRPRAHQLLLLSAGLALGAGSAWSVRHLRFSPASAQTSSRPAPGSPLPAPTPSLVLPPLLVGAEADDALDAWLALPPLANKAPIAEIHDRADRLRALLTLLPRDRFSRLFATLATRVGGAEAKVRRLAFDVWVDQDAPSAARWALAVAPGEALKDRDRAGFIRQAALAWAQKDFAAAYAWSRAIPDAKLGQGTSCDLLFQLAATDSTQAVALAQTGDEAFTKAAKNAVFEAWARRDPAAALRSLGGDRADQLSQIHGREEALAEWARRDPAAAIDWAAAQPIPEGVPSLLGFIGRYLSAHDAPVRPVIELIAKRDDIPDRARILHGLLGDWNRSAPAEALAWLDAVPDAAQRNDLIAMTMSYTMELSQADDLLTLARRLPDTPERDQHLAARISLWAKDDPDATLDWLDKHDDPALAVARREVEGTLITALARTDTAAAIARWQSLPADASRDAVAAQLASQWSKSDPAAATRWLATQLIRSDSPGEASRMGAAPARWAAQDPVAFAAWTETLPTEELRGKALDAFANHYSARFDREERSDPPPRLAYANQLAQIKDPAIRERALSLHLHSWLRTDLHAAKAWIESNDALAPEAAARLLTQTASSRP